MQRLWLGGRRETTAACLKILEFEEVILIKELVKEDYAYKIIKACICLFLIMTVTIVTVSIYKHSRDHSTRASNLPSPRPLHDIVEMKQYQQDYNSTAGPNTVQTH